MENSMKLIKPRPRQAAPITARRVAGFSLVELMLAVAIGYIILITALPAYSTMLHKNRIESASSQLYVSLNTARSEAVKRRTSVRVCPSTNSSSCNNAGDWSQGWIMYVDLDADDSPDSNEIIRVVDSIHGGVDMQCSDSMTDFVQFEPTGVATGNGGNTGEIRICHSNTTSKSKVIGISAIGRVSTTDRSQANCNVSS